MRGGRTLDTNTLVVMHVRGGGFAEVWVTSTDPYAADQFFAYAVSSRPERASGLLEQFGASDFRRSS